MLICNHMNKLQTYKTPFILSWEHRGWNMKVPEKAPLPSSPQSAPTAPLSLFLLFVVCSTYFLIYLSLLWVFLYLSSSLHPPFPKVPFFYWKCIHYRTIKVWLEERTAFQNSPFKKRDKRQGDYVMALHTWSLHWKAALIFSALLLTLQHHIPALVIEQCVFTLLMLRRVQGNCFHHCTSLQLKIIELFMDPRESSIRFRTTLTIPYLHLTVVWIIVWHSIGCVSPV